MTEFDTELPALPMPRDRGCPFAPPPTQVDMQRTTPVSRVRLWDESTPWMVTRYADVRAVLSDPRISANNRNPGFPHDTQSTKERTKDAQTFARKDGAEHARLRRMVASHFTFRQAEAMRPRIQQIVDDLINEMLDGPRPVDLVTAYALPAPSLVICDLLGVPYEDHQFFQRITKALVSYEVQVDEMRRAQLELLEYLGRLASAKTERPGDDLLSKLATEQVATGSLTTEDLTRIALLVLGAGHETIASMITLGSLALMGHPEQSEVLRETDDPKLLGAAVDELLRYLTVLHGVSRVAAEDLEIGGQTIRAGEGVIVSLAAGNRDGDFVADPDTLDITRNARGHLAFGYGAHHCFGQPLARVQLEIAYGSLIRRIPGLRLADGITQDDLAFRPAAFVHNVEALPVTW